MKCLRCGGIDSWHEWKQKPYCSPYCKRGKEVLGQVGGEWTRAAKAELNANIDDVVQPIRYDGTWNPHYVSKYGTKTLEKEYGASKREIHKNIEKYG